ncbi:MAG: hypothetical protein ACI8P3_004463 [Saprospiraceae bacterium]|jgi:hypothetical protein
MLSKYYIKIKKQAEGLLFFDKNVETFHQTLLHLYFH